MAAPAPAQRPTGQRLRIPYRGLVATLLLVLLLVTPPATVLDREGAFADTRGDLFTNNAVPVRLKDTLQTDLTRVPGSPGAWESEDDSSWPAILDSYLKYDNLLVRNYAKEGLYEPIQLMVLTARHAAAFHNPEICFTAQHGAVRNLGTTQVTIPGVSNQTSVTMGRMLITYADRPARLVHNLYIVERHLLSQDRTTWVRFSLLGVDPGNLTKADALLGELEAHLLPSMFSGSGEARTTLGWLWTAVNPGVAALAAVAAVAPVAADLLVQRSKRGRP